MITAHGAAAPRAWLGTSWKMTKTIPEAREYATQLAGAQRPAGVQLLVLPAHTALAAVRDALPADGSVLLGAQNAHWGPEGAGTGEVSMRMVADAGAQVVELGHSERRSQFGESDESVALKVRAATDAAKHIETMSDPYVSADYRRRLAGVVVERALAAALERREMPA